MQPRPGTFDPSVTRAAAKALADDIAFHSGQPRDEIVEALVRAMDIDDEAAVIENNLLLQEWPVDANLRRVLGRAPNERRHAHRDAVERWVLDNGIAPLFDLGDRVDGRTGRPPTHVSGPIVRIDAKRALYVVALADGREVSVHFEDARPRRPYPGS